MRVALGSLDGLLSLDESVYSYFHDRLMQADGVEEAERKQREAVLRGIRNRTFSGMQRLVWLLRSSKLFEGADEVSGLTPQSELVPEQQDDWDFDIAPAAPPPSQTAPRPRLPTLSEVDIEKAFGFMTREEDDGMARLGEFRRDAGALGAVLCKEFRDTEARIDAAMARKHFDLVLRELDTGRESMTEGVFALLLLTFRHFLGEEDCPERSVLLPGYKNALERALTIRRGLADLRTVVTSENDWVIQDRSLDKKLHYEAITNLAEQLKDFCASEAFRFMRGPDQIELTRFLNTIGMGSYREATQACEGLARYLESMSAINQREVLQEHDKQLLQDIDTSLDAARSIITVSLSGTRTMVRQALTQAARLYGRNSAVDEQVAMLEAEPELLDTPEGLEKLIGRMQEILH
jgi:hypothetical protein